MFSLYECFVKQHRSYHQQVFLGPTSPFLEKPNVLMCVCMTAKHGALSVNDCWVSSPKSLKHTKFVFTFFGKPKSFYLLDFGKKQKSWMFFWIFDWPDKILETSFLIFHFTNQLKIIITTMCDTKKWFEALLHKKCLKAIKK